MRKKECKLRAAELHDEALFKDPPPKEDCPICFLPMPVKLICSISLPNATFSSVASAGHYISLWNLLVSFKGGAVSRESIDWTLAAYNNACAEMRSEARDSYIRFNLETM
jgi:hypothetical protein